MLSRKANRLSLLTLCAFFIIQAVSPNHVLGQDDRNASSKVSQEFEAKSDSSLKRHHRSIQAFPTIYYTPETDFGVGTSGLAIFRVIDADTNLRNSFISLSANYTLKKQVLFLLKHEINFNHHFLVRGEFGYYKYPDVYAGFGNNHAAEEFETFNAIYPRIKLDVLRRSKKHFIYGIRYAYQNTDIITIQSGGLLDTNQPEGYNGSIFSSIGMVTNYDSRDFIFAPTTGWYSELSFSTSQKAFGASFEDYVFQIDLRKYTRFLKKHTIALQLTSELRFGNPAFNHSAIMGGEFNMRGYRYGVFRDLNSYVFQSEFRSARFWKHFAGTLFGALGGVGKTYANTFLNTRYSYGVGLWVYPQPKKRLFVRFDYGQGWEPHQSHGFYVSMGNAF